MMQLNFRIFVLALAALMLTGCASVVNMASKEDSDKARQFNAPSAGRSGLYVYRDSPLGTDVKRDIRVDGKCLGKSAADVFFYTEVEGGRSHTIQTDSEFSPNGLEVFMEAGKNYFVKQVIKMGLLYTGADLEHVNEVKGKADVSKLNMAQPGTCSK